MKKKVVILHSSETVRRGLAGILHGYFNADIVQMSAPQNVDTSSGIFNYPVIVFMEWLSLNDGDELNFPGQNKNIERVLIFENDIRALPRGCKYSISLKFTSSEIYDTVKKCFDTGYASEAAHEGEGLTIREKDVLKLVAMGFSNKEIADRLSISIHTVISHRKNLTEKLGIKSISGLTVYAIINKLIDTSNINPEDLI
jgi:DNA-binding CsgD family transcriptional regulator